LASGKEANVGTKFSFRTIVIFETAFLLQTLNDKKTVEQTFPLGQCNKAWTVFPFRAIVITERPDLMVNNPDSYLGGLGLKFRPGKPLF
jgi:hypothetical protein